MAWSSLSFCRSDTEAPETRGCINLLTWSELSGTHPTFQARFLGPTAQHLCSVHQVFAWARLSQEVLGVCEREHREKLKRFKDLGVTGRSWGDNSTSMPSTHRDGQTFQEASVPGALAFPQAVCP